MYFLAILFEEEVFKTVFETSIEKGLMALNPSHSFTTPRLLASFHQDKAPVSQLLVVVGVVEVLPPTQILVMVMEMLPPT